jgi:hypothetical protein
MSDAIHPIRLCGGPYDGDASMWNALPPHLWAYPCKHDPAHEAINGIHWGEADQFHGSQPGAHEYRYSHADQAGHVYTWVPIMRHRFPALQKAIKAP